MKLGDKIPVEPLSAAARARIEAATFAALAARTAPRSAAGRPARWPVLALGGLATAQLVAAAAFLLLRGNPAAHTAPSTTRLVAREQATDTRLGDVSVHLEPASALVVTGAPETGSVVVLERGAARFAVAKRGPRPAFVVLAGDVRVEVVGTRFRVERQGDGARVDTYEGSVRVTTAERSALVRAGEHWSVAERVNEARGADAGAALPLPAAGTDRSQPNTPPSAAAPSATGLRHGHPPAKRASQVATEEDHRRAFEQTEALEASDPERALRQYRALSTQPDGWGANALFAMGRLELERGDRSGALTNLRRYLAQYPHGANASDARALIAQLTAGRPQLQAK